MTKTGRFPRANDAMRSMQDFRIGGRVLSLYIVDGRCPSAPYSLYWNDDPGPPLQHAMTAVEVFAALHRLLEPEDKHG